MSDKRKIKYEVEVDTSQAAGKIESLGSDVALGGGSPGMSAGADKLARSMEATAKSTEKFSHSIGSADNSMTRVVRSFATFGAGMAMRYASAFMPEGRARNAVEVAGAGAQGAGMGAMVAQAVTANPVAKVAMVAGSGIANAVMARSEQTEKQEKFLADFAKGEKDFQEIRAWRDRMLEISEMPAKLANAQGVQALEDKLESIRSRSAKAAEALQELNAQSAETAKSVKSLVEEEKLEAAAEKEKELSQIRAKILQVESLQRNLDNQAADLESSPASHDPRASLSGLDALERVGASFGAGPADGARDMVLEQRKTNDTLLVISNKLNNGAGQSVWR